jgi:hypothetical protein
MKSKALFIIYGVILKPQQDKIIDLCLIIGDNISSEICIYKELAQSGGGKAWKMKKR